MLWIWKLNGLIDTLLISFEKFKIGGNKKFKNVLAINNAYSNQPIISSGL